MKTDQQRYDRAAEDIATRVRKLLADIKPAIAAKHQLSGIELDRVFLRGVAFVVIELAKVADVSTDKIDD